VIDGSTATFTISAKGTGIKYQWQYSENGMDWQNADSTTDTLTVTATKAIDGRQYRCVVTDDEGTSLTTQHATPTLPASLPITTQPQNQTVIDGSTATFTVAAKGTDIKYQWQYSDNGADWQNADSTTDTLTVTATKAIDGRQYRCIVTDSEGTSITSNAATLTVESEPAVPPKEQKGDLNGDGQIDNRDVVLLARYLVKLTQFTEKQIELADMNGDGTVSNTDLVRLARYMVGLNQ
jgi:hypothetical protein